MRAALAIALCASGCFGGTFDCGGDDSRCDPGERCLVDPRGPRCAVVDPMCATGYRYTRSAGALAGTCSLPTDGGASACAADGDPCSDGDACTDGDRCQGGACRGTPKSCPVPSCSGGVVLTSTCQAGACVATPSSCGAYPCAGNTCATSCQGASGCTPGNYCSAGRCFACDDFLAQPTWLPVYGAPTPIPGLSDPQAADRAPSASSDGNTVYFASDRSGGLGGLDLWRAVRAGPGTPFAAPAPLGAPVDTATDEADPLAWSSALVFAADGAGSFDLYAAPAAMGGFGPPALLPGGTIQAPLDSPGQDRHPALSDDGTVLVFASDRASMPPGDPRLGLYRSARASAALPFGPADPLPGLDPLGAWSSPSLALRAGAAAGALFAINAAIPSRTEAQVARVDATGAPSGPQATLAAVDLAGGAALTVSADLCTLLVERRAPDPAGDLAWSGRTGVAVCGSPICGSTDGCCPAGCTSLADADCPTPRTDALHELAPSGGGDHDYLLAGETAPGGYTATGATLRVFVDPLPGAVQLSRFSTNGCDGQRYTYVGTDASRMGYAFERALGYVFLTARRGTARLYRARREASGCDEQLTFDLATCNALAAQGYTCESDFGFAISP